MSDIEVKLKVTTEGQQSIDAVAQSVTKVGQAGKLSTGELNLFDATFKSLQASGLSTQHALDDMSKSAQGLGQNIANAAKEMLAAEQAATANTVATETLSNAHKELSQTLRAQTISSTMAAGAAFRELEGQMSIRAVERFATGVLGLGGAFQAIFPLVGLIGTVEVLDKILPKANALKDAIKAFGEEAKRADDQVADLNRTIAGLANEKFESAYGKAALYGKQAFDTQTQILADKNKLALLEKEISDTQSDSKNAFLQSVQDQGIGKSDDYEASLTKIKELEQEKRVLETQIYAREQTAAQFSRKELQQSTDDFHKNDTAGDGLVSRRDSERIRLRKELGDLQAKELTGVDAINQKRDAELDKLRAQKLLTADIAALVGAIYATQAQIYTTKTLPKEILEAGQRSDDAVGRFAMEQMRGRESDIHGPSGLDDDSLRVLREATAKFKREKDESLKALEIGDSSDANGVKRSLEVTMRGNATAVSGGSKTAAGASQDNYQARIAAAQEVFDIETRRLSLIDDEGKRQDVLATARKRYADDIYNAEAKHEEDLQALRQKNLDEYKQFFVGLVNASLTGGNAVQTLMKSVGHQIMDKVVGNIAGLTFDTVQAHMPTIPGQTNAQGGLTTLGKVFNGVPGLSHQNPAQQQGVLATTRLTTSTDSLRVSVDRLASAMNGRSTSPAGGSGGGSGSGGFGGFGSLSTDDSGNPIGGVSGDMGDGLPMDSTGMAHGVPSFSADDDNSSSGASVGKIAGSALAIGGGALQAYQGFSKGGAKGIASGVGGALTAAAGIASLIPGGQVVGLALGIAAGVSDLVGAFMGDPKQLREQAINTAIAKNQYMAPTALNVTQGPGGTYQDFDARGNLRTSTMRAVPQVLEPYITSRHLNGATTASYYDAPGQTTAPFSGTPGGAGGQSGVTIVINGGVHAIDSQTFAQSLSKAHVAIGNALAEHLFTHEGPASNAIRYVAGR